MSIIKRIIGYIKNIFLNNEKQEKENNIVIEDTKKISEDILSNLRPGDIIWAKRYNNKQEMNLIKEKHREGPFIVVSICDGKLICSYGSSTEPDIEKQHLFFNIECGKYYLIKNTYFRLCNLKIIDNYSFLKKINELSIQDRNHFFKNFKLNNNSYYKVNGTDMDFKLYLQPGDIISHDNKRYIVININKNKMFCILLNNNISQLDFSNFKKLNYLNLIELDSNLNYSILGTLDNDLFTCILKKQKQVIENYQNQKNTQRGSVIVKNNKYYYIYGEESKDWLVFEINKKSFDDNDELKLKKTTYYTNYKETRVDKASSFETIALATLEEIELAKEKRKNYKEAEKKEKEYQATQHLRLNVGDVIENINYENMQYIIIAVQKHTYECLSVGKIKKAIYDPILIKKQDTRIAKKPDLSGIKWLDWNPSFKLHRITKKNNIDRIFDAQERYLSELNKNKSTEPIKFQNDNLLNSNIKFGSIIKVDGCENETFVVKDVLDNMVCCISSFEKGLAHPKMHYFDKKIIIDVENKQKRK